MATVSGENSDKPRKVPMEKGTSRQKRPRAAAPKGWQALSKDVQFDLANSIRNRVDRGVPLDWAISEAATARRQPLGLVADFAKK